MNGKIVIDGSWEGTLLEEPITFLVEEGLVVGIEVKWLKSCRAVLDEARVGLRPSRANLSQYSSRIWLWHESQSQDVRKRLDIKLYAVRHTSDLETTPL